MGCVMLVCIACVVIPVAADNGNVTTTTVVPTTTATTAVPTTTATTAVPTTTATTAVPTTTATTAVPTTTATTAVPTTTATTAVPTTTATTAVPTTTATTAVPTTTTTTATPLVASFTASPISGTAPLTVQFKDTSTGSPTTWDWAFGDGGSNSNENPSYVYTTAGTWDVTLTIGDGGTLPSAISTQTTTITVSAAAVSTTVPAVTSVSPAYGPVSTSTSITIIGTGFTGATGVTVGGAAATNVVVVSPTEITATTPATSTAGQVDVLVMTPSGTSSTVAGDEYTFAAAATTIPLPLFIASPTSGTAPLEVSFTDESTGSPTSWSWAFGDGNTSTLQNPTNTYVNDGTYTVSLTEENSLGTNTTTMTGYIVVGATTPVAAFTAAPTSGTAPLTVQFTDQSTGSPTTWEWSFGDGSAGSAQSPSHTYQTAGTYTVTLTATNSEGSSTNSATQTITVDSAEPATTVPTPVITTAPTFAVGAEATTSSVDNWLAQQNAEIPSVAPTKKSPGYDALAALIGCGAVAGIALRRRH